MQSKNQLIQRQLDFGPSLLVLMEAISQLVIAVEIFAFMTSKISSSIASKYKKLLHSLIIFVSTKKILLAEVLRSIAFL